MILPKRLACSFCRKSEAEVAKLVAGASAYICDVCARQAVEIMKEGPSASPRPGPVGAGAVRRIWRSCLSLGRNRRGSECQAAAG